MRLEELLTLQAPRIAIRTKGRILFIRPADVVAVEARRNYVLLQLRTTSHLLHDSISATEEKLQRYGFIRIHRSVLVNSSCVTAIEPQPTGKYLVRTQPGRDYVATRNYLKNLRALAESWIGSAAFLAQNP
jgi:two-component system LytT family response regulator